MLIGNYSVLLKIPMRFRAGSTTSVEPQLMTAYGFSGPRRNRFYPQGATTALATYAVPTGCYPMYTWIIPQKAGEMRSSYTTGASSLSSANLAGGVNGTADLTGSGDITQALGALIVSAVASLSGAGTISSAELLGKLEAAASLSGSGDLTAAIGAIAGAVASLTGSGTVSDAQPYATGDMSADIKGYGALTPEGIRDSVWSAILANYPDAGTAGLALATASSGGVDPTILAAAVWTYVSRTLTENPGITAADVVAALQATTIPVDIQTINTAEVIGTGTTGDAWRGVGVPP